jgi:hypothetical protein
LPVLPRPRGVVELPNGTFVIEVTTDANTVVTLPGFASMEHALHTVSCLKIIDDREEERRRKRPDG